MKTKELYIDNYVKKNSTMLKSILNKRDLLKYYLAANLSELEQYSKFKQPLFVDIKDDTELITELRSSISVNPDIGLYYNANLDIDNYYSQYLYYVDDLKFVINYHKFIERIHDYKLFDFKLSDNIRLYSTFFYSLPANLKYGKIELKLDKDISFLKINSNMLSVFKDNYIKQVVVNDKLFYSESEDLNNILIIKNNELRIEVYKTKEEEVYFNFTDAVYFTEYNNSSLFLYNTELNSITNDTFSIGQNLTLDTVNNYINRISKTIKSKSVVDNVKSNSFLLSPLVRLNSVFTEKFVSNVGLSAAYIGLWESYRQNISDDKPKGLSKDIDTSITKIHEKYINDYENIIRNIHKTSAIRSLFYGYTYLYNYGLPSSNFHQKKYDSYNTIDLSNLLSEDNGEKTIIPLTSPEYTPSKNVKIIGYNYNSVNTVKFKANIPDGGSHPLISITFDGDKISGITFSESEDFSFFFSYTTCIVGDIYVYNSSLKNNVQKIRLEGYWTDSNVNYTFSDFNYNIAFTDGVKIPFINYNSNILINGDNLNSLNSDLVKFDKEASLLIVDNSEYNNSGDLVLQIPRHTYLVYTSWNGNKINPSQSSIPFYTDKYFSFNLNDLIEYYKKSEYKLFNSVRLNLGDPNMVLSLLFTNTYTNSTLLMKISGVVNDSDIGDSFIEPGVFKLKVTEKYSGSQNEHSNFCFYNINTGEFTGEYLVERYYYHEVSIEASTNGVLIQKAKNRNHYPKREMLELSDGEVSMVDACTTGVSIYRGRHLSMGGAKLHSEANGGSSVPYHVYRFKHKIDAFKKNTHFFRKFKINVDYPSVGKIYLKIQHPFGRNAKVRQGITSSNKNRYIIVRSKDIINSKTDWIEVILMDTTGFADINRNTWLSKLTITVKEVEV